MTKVEHIKKTLTRSERRKSIKAMQELLDLYKGEGLIQSCPLCVFERNNCCKCPWRVMTGGGCLKYVEAEFGQDVTVTRLRKSRNPRWTKLRKRQLPRWIGYYKEALK